MNPTQHQSNNDVLRSPPGATIDECRPLAITRLRYQDGSEAVASYWVPTVDELARLNAGKPVAIVAWGRTHPPLYVLVDGDEGLPQ